MHVNTAYVRDQVVDVAFVYNAPYPPPPHPPTPDADPGFYGARSGGPRALRGRVAHHLLHMDAARPGRQAYWRAARLVLEVVTAGVFERTAGRAALYSGVSFLEFAFGAEPDSPTRTLPVADQEEDGLAHDLELLVAAPGDGALPGLEERIVRYFRHRWALWTLP